MKKNKRDVTKKLKVHSANKTRKDTFFKVLLRLRLSRRFAASGLVFAFLISISLLSVGCDPPIIFGLPRVVDDFVLKNAEFEGLSFEPDFSNNYQPAKSYWLRAGDQVAVKLNTAEIHWEKSGEICEFPNNNSIPNCQICDYCNPPADYNGPPCMGLPAPDLPELNFDIVADLGFIQTGNPTKILDVDSPQVPGACNQSSPPIFTPTGSGLYRAYSGKDYNFKGDTDGEIKLHVVSTGSSMTQTTAYQLTHQPFDNTNYWTWKTEGTSVWMENFSPHLRVTEVRLFRGKCADGSMQGKQCAVPTERVPVKPSRLLFLPDFQGTSVSAYPGEATLRCYGISSANSDNSISIKNCRETNTATQTIQKEITPTYRVDDGNPAPDPQLWLRKLTWFIEFNTNEGGDADLDLPGNQPMPTDAELIVEFTIEAN